MFFSASARSYCRWPYRRCSIRRLSLRADAGSNERTPPELASKPKRSVSPPPPRRKSAAARSWCYTCASASPRTPPSLQQNARSRHYLRRVLARANHGFEPIALLGAQLHHVLLDRNILLGHESPPSLLSRRQRFRKPPHFQGRGRLGTW